MYFGLDSKFAAKVWLYTIVRTYLVYPCFSAKDASTPGVIIGVHQTT